MRCTVAKAYSRARKFRGLMQPLKRSKQLRCISHVKSRSLSLTK
jgi:hypothetical protein